ncbi:cytochrome c oxidase subunit II [Halobacillus sp. HZG1]|uniref:cytochrome c oxidase subunit II n=1 Tax=Halobacillus sp. HZG1 TaxID=3111769 RepID=UPI002DBE4CD4|nr:cytochrome c oxidase subunit II [Halobacillus sp. HZG1]MEC3882990.1 cytochrome c oxidase subunit II [Halobacillus sp. HZG1]
MNKRVLSFFVIAFLTGCQMRVLNPKSDTADTLTNLIYLSFGIMMLVLIVVFVLFVYFLRKFRERGKAKFNIPPDEKENKWLEITWTIVPVLLLAILAVPTVKATYDLTSKVSGSAGGSKGDAMIVEVVGQQYNWKFTYENGKESYDELVLPVDQEVQFRLTSNDVIHSFWIPNLSGKIDVLPGEMTKLSFEPREEGMYQGKCAEFCGAEHTLMRFETKVMSQQSFENWVQEE